MYYILTIIVQGIFLLSES